MLGVNWVYFRKITKLSAYSENDFDFNRRRRQQYWMNVRDGDHCSFHYVLFDVSFLDSCFGSILTNRIQNYRIAGYTANWRCTSNCIQIFKYFPVLIMNLKIRCNSSFIRQKIMSPQIIYFTVDSKDCCSIFTNLFLAKLFQFVQFQENSQFVAHAHIVHC